MYCSRCGGALPDAAESCPACGAPVAAAERRSGYLAPPPTAAYWRRVAAWSIDSVLIVVIPFFAFAELVVSSEPAGQSGESGQTGVGFLFYLVVPLYSAILHRYWNGQTLGKRLLRIRVCGLIGQPITLGQSLGRSYLRMAFLFLTFGILWVIDALWPLANRDRQSLHDRAAGTLVVAA